MTTEASAAIDSAALRALMAASGVALSAAEAEAVAGSLARIRAAMALLPTSPPFDLAPESFARLLDRDADEAGP